MGLLFKQVNAKPQKPEDNILGRNDITGTKLQQYYLLKHNFSDLCMKYEKVAIILDLVFKKMNINLYHNSFYIALKPSAFKQYQELG